MKLNAIVELLRNLETDELNKVLSRLNETHEQNIDPIKSFKELILKRKATLLGDRPYCPHCESQRIVKNGLKDGRQRFKCKDCKHTFTWTNNTILFGMKISYDTLLKYCDWMMHKMTIREYAVHCGISKTTGGTSF